MGEDIASSDIDIAIIGAKEKESSFFSLKKRLKERFRSNFYESLGSVNKNLRENLINGTAIYGIVEI